MSITRHMSEMTENPFGLSAAGQRCFHCGEFLQDPVVMWSGADGQTIYLHGPCVERLQSGLLRDALELKYAGQPCWNQLA
jgi:hypothetical protein